jgi:hypothetical protein
MRTLARLMVILMLAKQVLQEINASGRGSKKTTQLAMDDVARVAADEQSRRGAGSSEKPHSTPFRLHSSHAPNR